MPALEEARSASRAVQAALAIAFAGVALAVSSSCAMEKVAPDREPADAGARMVADAGALSSAIDAGAALVDVALPPAPAPPREICAALPDDSTGQVAPIPSDAAAEAVPSLRLPEGIKPTQEALSLTIDPMQPRFAGTAAIALELEKPRSNIWLHGRDLHITEAHLDLQGAQLPVKIEQLNAGGLLRVSLPCLVSGRALLSISWDAAFNDQLAGIYVVHEGPNAYAVTQFEAIDARRAFPSFDEPLFKIPWDVELVVPAADVAISNNPIISESPLEAGQRRVRFSTTPPLPSYLLAFAVGPFDIVIAPLLPPNEVRDHPLQVRGVAPQGRGGELKFALEASAEILPRLERWFGIPFPYEKLDHIAVMDSSAGAMENAGAIIYSEETLLFRPGISTPRDEETIAVVMAHEMAHQWFGDLVTLRWWTDTWLNESFAEWMEAKIVNEWRPDFRAPLDDISSIHIAMGLDATTTARPIQKPVTDEASIDDQFDPLTYDKGAALISMIEHWIGEENFRKGIQSYLRTHANGGGSSEDLFAVLSLAAGRDVAAPMRSFLEQAGIPRVRVKLVCNGTKPRLLLEQERDLPTGADATELMRGQRWQIPFCARASANAQDVSSCGLFTEAKGDLELIGKRCPDWVMPNEGAHGYYRSALAPDALDSLVRNRNLLKESERMSLTSDLLASYFEGAMPAAEVLHALSAFTRDRDPEVSLALAGLLGDARSWTLDPALRPELDSFAAAAYLPLAKALTWKEAAGEDRTTAEERNRVLAFLALTVREPTTRAQGAELGIAYANMAGDTFDSHAISPALSQLALDLAVQAGGPELREGLIDRLWKTNEAVGRRRILTALGSVLDPEVARSLLELSLDPRMHKTERLILASSFGGHEETRAVAREYLRKNWDALLANQAGWAVGNAARVVLRSACERKILEESETFLRPRLEKFPETKLTFDHGLESARLCIARREGQGKSLRAFFANTSVKAAAKKPAGVPQASQRANSSGAR